MPVTSEFREFPSSEILVPGGLPCVACGANLRDRPTAVVLVSRSLQPTGTPFFSYYCPDCGAAAQAAEQRS